MECFTTADGDVSFALFLLLALPGTEPLKFEGDPAEAMVEGIKRYLGRLTAET